MNPTALEAKKYWAELFGLADTSELDSSTLAEKEEVVKEEGLVVAGDIAAVVDAICEDDPEPIDDDNNRVEGNPSGSDKHWKAAMNKASMDTAVADDAFKSDGQFGISILGEFKDTTSVTGDADDTLMQDVQSSGSSSTDDTENDMDIVGLASQFSQSLTINPQQPVQGTSLKSFNPDVMDAAPKATFTGPSVMVNTTNATVNRIKATANDTRAMMNGCGEQVTQQIGTPLESAMASSSPCGKVEANVVAVEALLKQLQIGKDAPFSSPQIKEEAGMANHLHGRLRDAPFRKGTCIATQVLREITKGGSASRNAFHKGDLTAGMGMNGSGGGARQYNGPGMRDVSLAAHGLIELHRGRGRGVSRMNAMAAMQNAGNAHIGTTDCGAARDSCARTGGVGPIRKPARRAKGKKALRVQKKN